jgi:prepilin-type N-terminal cleavage/methylation domain-containing protein
MPTTTPMRDLPHSPRDERGFTLIEVLVAAFVLTLGVLATLTLITGASRATAVNQSRDAAVNLARELVEGARGLSYDKLTATGIQGELQAIPGLQDAPVGGIYQITRRGVLYTVEPSVCIMDDSKDGGGSRPSGLSFCPDSVAPGTADKNPEDYKRIRVRLSWRRDNVTRSVTQTGLVNNPGSATGPAVRSLVVVSPAVPAPYEITSTGATVGFQITTSSRPQTINWSVDGSVQPSAPTQFGATGLVWNFTWDVSAVDDGPYLVSAEAFNQYGVSGPGRTETITLNRYRPRPPSKVAGGRTKFGTVEIEWSANTERDVIGYEVRRVTDNTIVCPMATQKTATLCIDPAPPAGDPVEYEVRAFDKAPVTAIPRASDASSPPLQVQSGSTAPYPPEVMSATTANGIVTITWKRPTPGDDDPGDGVAFYRVYRDGVLLGNRYDRWYDGGSLVTWEDRATGGLPHTYWITSVDKTYLESSFVPAVLP